MARVADAGAVVEGLAFLHHGRRHAGRKLTSRRGSGLRCGRRGFRGGFGLLLLTTTARGKPDRQGGQQGVTLVRHRSPRFME
jgi:hypothetical protein